MIKITKKILESAKSGGIATYYRRYLQREGLSCEQVKFIQGESDFCDCHFARISNDNGKTYGEWKKVKKEESIVSYGGDEYWTIKLPYGKVYNPVHKHYVYSYMTRYFVDGHKIAYEKSWSEGNGIGKNGIQGCFDHQFISVLDDNGNVLTDKMVKYERGNDFNPENPRDVEFLLKNNGYQGANGDIIVLKNGDILFAVAPRVVSACQLAGISPEPYNNVGELDNDFRAVMVARGVFNKKTNGYDLTFSNPLMFDKHLCSRGVMEPILAELESGKLLLVMRGSNLNYPGWNTCVKEGTPGYKWYSISNDGGKTFSEPKPWQFDNGDMVYSPSSIFALIRSSKNNKLYWVGNVTDNKAYGNFPRFPLNIAQVSEETGLLIKDTFTEIDTKQKGETERVQLSNFYILEDRETLKIEITLSKIGQYNTGIEDESKVFYGDAMLYEIELD